MTVPTDTLQSAPSPFIKNLASSDPSIRDEAFSSLQLFISNRSTPLTPLDHLKIQKGLFYALYMSDKPRAQHSLCQNIAGLVHPLPGALGNAKITNDDAAHAFLSAYWETICREWAGIDRLRMDKFLLCMRLVLRASLLRSKSEAWNENALQIWVEMMENGPLNAQNINSPDAIRYHILDIWADEIETVLGEDEEDRIEVAVAKKLAAPLEILKVQSPNKMVRTKAAEALSDERAMRWLGLQKGGEVEAGKNGAEEDEEWDGFGD